MAARGYNSPLDGLGSVHDTNQVDYEIYVRWPQAPGTLSKLLTCEIQIETPSFFFWLCVARDQLIL